jgi:hypothetical protein
MAKQKDESEVLQTPFWFNGTALPEKNFSESMKRTQTAFEDGFRTLSDEALHFVRERLDHSSEAIAKCSECKDIPALLAVQQKWFADMARDYYEESMRMGDVMRKIFAAGFTAIDSQERKPDLNTHPKAD